MDHKEMLGWVSKNCKFAAVPIPGTQSTNPLEVASREVANQVLQFMNKAKQTGHGSYDTNQFMLKMVNERASTMGLNPAQKQEFTETVQDAVGAHGGMKDPMPKGVGMQQKPSSGTPFQGAKSPPSGPPPTGMPSL